MKAPYPNLQKTVAEVNKVLFSNNLDKVVKLLAARDVEGSQREGHFAIGRIYFAAHSRGRSNFKREEFKELAYCGKEMLHNLFNCYVHYDPTFLKSDLFSQQEQDNPIFAFLLNYMHLVFRTILIQFSRIFERCFLPQRSETPLEFFKNVEKSVKFALLPFLKSLPSEFTNLFSELYDLIQACSLFQPTESPFPALKQLLLNQFFLNPNHYDLAREGAVSQEKYEAIANLLNSLFYDAAEYQQIRKYTELSSIL